MNGTASSTTTPPRVKELLPSNPRFWFLVAILGSLVVHAALFSWFQATRLHGLVFSPDDRLTLRKFNLERVEINPQWLEPEIAPPEHVSQTPAPARASLAPGKETRTFSRMLADAPTSPTLPSGKPPIPNEKPAPAIGDLNRVPPEDAMRSLLDHELEATREQQLNRAGRTPATGRPVLDAPGAAVAPKGGSKELAPPTQPVIGPDQGPVVGEGRGIHTTSIRLDDFFGPGGLPPPATHLPRAKEKEPDKPDPVDAASEMPQGLRDKPTTSQKFDSLNRFLNVELFTHERMAATGGKEGYFLVRISAKPNQQLRVIPKDVYMVLDVSSSIGGDRLDSYVATVLSAVAQLNREDRFKLMVFRDQLHHFRQDWLGMEDLPAKELRSWLEKLETGGVTDFYDGLEPLTRHKSQEGRTAVALVMSDGLPTKGVLDSTQIISELSEANDSRTSIFAMSNGRDVNNFLLDLLAYCNQGWLQYSKEIPGSTQKFEHLVKQVRNPLFTDVRFRFAGVDEERVYPQNLPNLYQDSPLLLFGRYEPGRTTSLSLQILGESFNSTRELLVTLQIPETPTGPDTLPSTWARQKIYDSLGRMTRSRARQDRILEEVGRLSKEYEVVLPHF